MKRQGKHALGQRRFRITALAVISGFWAASASSSCGSSEAPEMEAAADIPALREMLDEARLRPPLATDGGYRLSTALATAPISASRSSWSSSSHALAIEVDSKTGNLSVQSSHGNVRANHLGARTGSVGLEGSGIAVRSARGAAHALLFARSASVEDLLVDDGTGEDQGYDLDLPVGWSLQAPRRTRGIVEIRDPGGHPRLRVVARTGWDARGNALPVETRVQGRRITFSLPALAPGPRLIDPEWQDAASPAQVRSRGAVATLPDGTIIHIGGESSSGGTSEALCTTEIYDALSGVWESGPPIEQEGDAECTPLMDAAAVPLRDGTVLVTGGANRTTANTVSADGTPHLIGANQAPALRTAWIYDPVRRAFRTTGSMAEPRVHHTATLLPSGQVLITGGSDRLAPLEEAAYQCPPIGDAKCMHCVGTPSAELYDPDSETFSEIPMPTPRACHTATLLEDGSVLLVGGGGDAVPLIDNLSGSPVGGLSLFKDGSIVDLPTQLRTPRLGHIAVLDPISQRLLVALGRNVAVIIQQNEDPEIDIGELVDTGQIVAGSPPTTTTPISCTPVDDEGSGGGPTDTDCPLPRSYAASTLTRDGKALLVGGQEKHQGSTLPSPQVDFFDFALQRFEAGPTLPSPARKPVLHTLPSGKIMLLGQTVPPHLYDDEQWEFSPEPPAHMSATRAWETVTRLSDATLLITGGHENYQPLDSAEIFDPRQTPMTSTALDARMSAPRSGHTATLLPATASRGERVLLIGGIVEASLVVQADSRATETAELYDPATRTFEPTGPMAHHRAYHTTTRLPSGEVLVVGGVGDGHLVEPTAEIYDPESGTFDELPPPLVSRWIPSSALLPSGEVVIAGGFSSFTGITGEGEQSAVEIFEPKTRTFRAAGHLIVPRGYVTATVLSDGTVLFAGGSEASTSAEIYDPATGSSRLTAGFMEHIRVDAEALMLPSGKVLVSGGTTANAGADPLDDAEVFDPVTEQFSHVVPDDGMAQPRVDHSAILLGDGRVALFGGSTVQADAQQTDRVDLLRPNAFPNEVPVVLDQTLENAAPGVPQAVNGRGFTSYWETSSGPNPSPSNVPTAVWMPVTGTPSMGSFAPWSATSTSWTPRSTAFSGPGLLFATRSGTLSSDALAVDVGLAENGVACSSDAACGSGFCSDSVCCNVRCHVAGDPEALCRACSVAMGAARDGECTDAAPDTDPQNDCVDLPQCAVDSATCGGDGRCKPCKCNTRLDCAEGYACTADGNCEKPASSSEAASCSVVTPDGRADEHALVAALATALLVLKRRRRERAKEAHQVAPSRSKFH